MWEINKFGGFSKLSRRVSSSFLLILSVNFPKSGISVFIYN